MNKKTAGFFIFVALIILLFTALHFAHTFPFLYRIVNVIPILIVVGAVVLMVLKAKSTAKNVKNIITNQYEDKSEYKNLNSGTINTYENTTNPTTFDTNFDNSVFENNNYFNGDE
jgi:c-di-AMP phosphodiesterase-like protein